MQTITPPPFAALDVLANNIKQEKEMRYKCHQKDKITFQMILLSAEKIQESQLEAPGNNEHTEPWPVTK